ncbi:hypothetical protein [Thalassotalea maritima]|uniref:hypothetical protein n=1 Tax=Thalassotalea maritima TaxID=3242416 RepID=UPI003528C5B1
MHKISLLLLGSLSLLICSAVLADEPTNKTKAELAVLNRIGLETNVDQGLKNFGYISGLALGCVAKAQKVELEKEVLDINGDINRTLGADRAFLFAAAFGYGTNIQLEQSECKEVLDSYEKQVDAFKQGAGDMQ